MRIALGGITHEANTFCPHAADMEDFAGGQILRTDEIVAGWQETRTEQAGALSVLTATADCFVIPTFLARGLSCGPIQEQSFRLLTDGLLRALRAALPVDGVLLVLHGAMMATHEADATGELLAQVRTLVGPSVPIVCTLDLHANVTERMVQQATALIGYHTAPHIDMFETGQKAAQVLISIVMGQVAPTSALVRLPMLLPPENSTHGWGPLAEVINTALEMEQSGRIVHASVYPVQPWMDTEDVAASVLVVTDNDPDSARAVARSLAENFWSLRHEFQVEITPLDVAVQHALGRASGTVILCDSADSTTSGSTGDSTAVLAALLGVGQIDDVALVNIVDPLVITQAITAGVGSEVTVRVGGSRAPEYFEPVTLHAYVKTISDGNFTFKGPGMRGVPHQMGRAVVLYCGGIHLLVMERPVSQWDPQMYRSVGEEPSESRIVHVKSPMAFRAGYEGIFDEVYVVAAPGAASPDLASLPWRNLPRPIYPIDPDTSWP